MWRALVVSLLCAAQLWASGPAAACSSYAVKTAEGTLFGRNTDGDMAVPGILVVNKRGIEKQSLPWGFAGPSLASEKQAQWTARYGSLTFSHFGREFPDGGVNEAGLIIEEMSLGDTRYPHRDDLPSMSVQQWIQYQLDNHGSVADVISGLGTVNIRGWPWHFTVADATGNCAIVEFLEGTPVIGRGTLQNGCVLTNDRLEDATSQLQVVRGAIPDATAHQGSGSTERFIRANALLTEGVPSTDLERRNFAFDVLNRVAQGKKTFRSIVYDLGARKVYFRSASNPGIKEISLDMIDFSANSPVTMLNIETQTEGDVTRLFKPYDPRENRRIVEGTYRLIRSIPEVSAKLDAELAVADTSEERFIDIVANYPTTTHPARTP